MSSMYLPEQKYSRPIIFLDINILEHIWSWRFSPNQIFDFFDEDPQKVQQGQMPIFLLKQTYDDIWTQPLFSAHFPFLSQHKNIGKNGGITFWGNVFLFVICLPVTSNLDIRERGRSFQKNYFNIFNIFKDLLTRWLLHIQTQMIRVRIRIITD